MRKENSKFITKFISEAGSYLVNADFFAFVELKDYACYVLVDGIDPDEKKESAKLAVTTVVARFSENPGISSAKMKNYIKAAHEVLINEADEIRLEASIIVIVTDYKKYRTAHVGNCRMNWIRNGEIKDTTKDTSLTQRMADNEEIPIDQISSHEERNNLYAYLGQPGRFTPIVSKKRALMDGDILLMQTRGAWENVGTAELIDAVDGVSKAEEVCTGLEDVILSQRLEIIENYTIATIFVDKIYKNPNAGKYKKFIKIFTMIFMIVAMIVSTLIVSKLIKRKNGLESMESDKKEGLEYIQEEKYTQATERFESANNTGKQLGIKKSSKHYNEVETVRLYYKMLESVNIAIEEIDNDMKTPNHFIKAKDNFETATEYANKLKDDYDEEDNLASVIKDLEYYSDYCQYMIDAITQLNSQDFTNASESLNNAKNILTKINIDDESVENEIQLLNFLKYKKSAESNMNDADTYSNQGQYSAAQTAYEKAAQDFKNASEYGTDLNSYKTEAESKANDMMEKASQQSDSEKNKQAQKILETAKELLEKGKYDEALAKLDVAESLCQDTNNQTLLQSAQKLQNDVASAQQSSNIQQNASDTYENVIQNLLDEDYEKAINELKALRDKEYVSDSVKQNKINEFIDSIEDYDKARQEDKESLEELDKLKKEQEKNSKTNKTTKTQTTGSKK